MNTTGQPVQKKTLIIDPKTGESTLETSMEHTPSGFYPQLIPTTLTSSSTRTIYTTQAPGQATSWNIQVRGPGGVITRQISSSSLNTGSTVQLRLEPEVQPRFDPTTQLSFDSTGSSNRVIKIRGGTPATQFQFLKRLLTQFQVLQDKTSEQAL
jgi:hypothetical protein